MMTRVEVIQFNKRILVPLEMIERIFLPNLNAFII